MDLDGEISNVVQQMFALRSVEVVASASERAAKVLQGMFGPFKGNC